MRRCVGNASTVPGTKQALKRRNSLSLKKSNLDPVDLHLGSCPWLRACDGCWVTVPGRCEGSLLVPKGLK